MSAREKAEKHLAKLRSDAGLIEGSHSWEAVGVAYWESRKQALTDAAEVAIKYAYDHEAGRDFTRQRILALGKEEG